MLEIMSMYYLFSVLYCFSYLYPNISLLPLSWWLPSSVFLISYLCFSLTTYISQQNLSSSIKINVVIIHVFKWMITMNINKNNTFSISLTWLNVLFYRWKTNYTRELRYIHVQTTLCKQIRYFSQFFYKRKDQFQTVII